MCYNDSTILLSDEVNTYSKEKNMKKRWICLGLAVLMCTGVLFSCSEGAANTDADTTSDSSAANGTQADTNTDTQADTNDDKKEDKPVNKIEAMKNIKTIADVTPGKSGKVKIAFIGDSLTQGTGASDQPTMGYPGQLSRLLDSSKYTVGNFGKASSYVLPADNKYNVKNKTPELSYKNTQQYKDSIAFEPDVVVVMLGVNDIRSMSCDEARADLKTSLTALTREYCEMESVKKVYVATSIRVTNAATILQYCDGRLQQLQREVAEEIGLDLIDMYAMTRDYFNVKMHYTKDIVHPVDDSYGEMARAFYAALMGEEYKATVPEVSTSGVVYLKAGGKKTGLGDTPENAIDTLAKAVGLLRNGGGTIVICGPYSLTYETHLPYHTGVINITSKHGGVDYSTKGAKLGIAKNLYFYGDYNIDDVNIVSELANCIIVCNYNSVTIGKNVTTTLKQGVSTYPLLNVGYNVALGDTYAEDISCKGECNITVNAGTWAYLRGGNRRASQTFPNVGSPADAVLNITINGGEFKNTSTDPKTANVTSGTGMGGFGGTVNFTITGGTFKGDVYAIGRSGTNSTSTKAEVSGTVNMKVTGGTFGGSIKCEMDPASTKLTGKVNLTISSALKDKASGFTNVTVE